MHLRKLISLGCGLLLFSAAFASEYTMDYERNHRYALKSWSVQGNSAVEKSLLYYAITAADKNMSLEQQGRVYQYLLSDLAQQFDLAQADQHLYALQVIKREGEQVTLAFAQDELAANEIDYLKNLSIQKVYLGINEIKGNQRLVVIVQDTDESYAAFIALPKNIKLSPKANGKHSRFTVQLTSADPAISGRAEIQIGQIVEGNLELSTPFSLNNLGIASIFPVDWAPKSRAAQNIKSPESTWIARHR